MIDDPYYILYIYIKLYIIQYNTEFQELGNAAVSKTDKGPALMETKTPNTNKTFLCQRRSGAWRETGGWGLP